MSAVQTVDFARVAEELGFRVEQVENAVELLDAGNTVPFITRYRKERTGNLDETDLRAIQQKVQSLRQLAERAETILRLIDSQGNLTPELRSEIEQADTLKRLDDLYLPFRPKRTSRAAQARDRGLEPLANAVWNQDPTLIDLTAAATELIDAEKELNSVDDVQQGVADILSERISEDADIRARCRRISRKTGQLKVTATKKGKAAGDEYRNYFNYSESVTAVPPHRVLAINRGEKIGALRCKIEWDEARANTEILIFLRLNDHRFGEFLQKCVADAVSRLIFPSLDREIRREMTDAAESHATSVFARNLRNLLLQSPLKGERVLAIDPGFRTGCKIAVLDEVGNCKATDVIYVSGSAEKRAANTQKLHDLIVEHECRLVAIGNGTGCRETEEVLSELIAEKLPELRYLIVNEAGASVYSTSPIASEEFPDFDATVRGTISIGRRLLDPLSELVKIEPQHIGVGMYQHDVGAKRLKESLDDVVESCVNYVGVDLNTASASLLKYVSGLNQLIARRVVAWRDENGRFTSRKQLRDVAGIGDATFTQAAGFLRISGGDEPLDNTWIHPESYEPARKLLDRLSISPEQLMGTGEPGSEVEERFGELNESEIIEELQVGKPTLIDIIDALKRPGRDPRVDQPGPIFKQGILKLDDLHEGMELTGTVLNVVDFGAFVDVGLKDSGLVHISQLANKFISSPHEVVSVGDAVTAWVLGVDPDRKRVSLTMISPDAEKKKTRRKRKSRSRKRKRGAAPADKTANTQPSAADSVFEATVTDTISMSTAEPVVLSAETVTQPIDIAPQTPADVSDTSTDESISTDAAATLPIEIAPQAPADVSDTSAESAGPVDEVDNSSKPAE